MALSSKDLGASKSRGAFKGRREDHRLVTGAGRYTNDHNLPGQVRAVFVRSDLAHAEIRGIDTEAARAAKGVLAVITGADMEAAGCFRAGVAMPFTGRHGPLKAPRKPALASDRVRYMGEPVAMVVAETEALARDAAELVMADLVSLETVSDAVAALAENAPLIHQDVPGNLCFAFDFGDRTGVETAMAEAVHRVRLTLQSGRVIGNPLEPKAALARWDGGVLDLWSPSQGIVAMRTALSAAMAVDPEKLRLHAYDVGGAFGIRGHIYPEYVAVAHAARLVERPVKWVATRSETFVSDYHGRGMVLTADLALDADGHFLALHHDILCDMGAHASAAGPVTSVGNAMLMACGAYRIPMISGEVRLALTNRVPVSAYRGAGRPDMAYIVERLVDEAARQTGIDRIGLRRRNMIPASSFPYPIATAVRPASYDSADFATLIERALVRSDWDGFEARRIEAAGRGRLRGIGCALFIEPAGGSVPSDAVALTFDRDGDLLIHMVAVASGQGHETVFPELLGRQLGIDPERIALRGGRADSPVLAGGSAVGSRTLLSQGNVVTEAGRQLLAKAHGHAAGYLGVAPEALSYADGVFAAVGTNRSLTLFDLAHLSPGTLDTVAELPAPSAFPSGMHVAEVEIDPETGRCKLARYTSIDDCGTVINRTLVEGQIVGGLVQGLGQVFGELACYDERGQLLSGSFMDYVMPRADLLDKVSVELCGVASPANLLGAKGVGEAGTVGALPTAMNAIMDALTSVGVRHLDMPATPYRIWRALSGGRNHQAIYAREGNDRERMQS